MPGILNKGGCDRDRRNGVKSRVKTMILWTTQPASALEQIEKTGVFRCDPSRSFNLTKPDSLKKPYEWLTGKMRERIGDPPRGVVSPIWAWYIWDYEHRCPEPDSPAFLLRSEEKVLLTLDVPESELVLTDFDAWHGVMMGGYVSGARTMEECEREASRLDDLDGAALEEAIRRSWDNVFLTDVVRADGIVRGRYVQATFWEI